MIDEAVINRAAQTLAAAASSPARIVLFGSRARGDAGPWSDLEFLVIEDQVESKGAEMVRLRDALADLDVPVDVLVVSQEEAERVRLRPGSLVKRAMAEGRVLLSPDTEQAELLLGKARDDQAAFLALAALPDMG